MPGTWSSINVAVIIVKGQVAGIRYLETLSCPPSPVSFVPQQLGWWPLS